jgi:chromosomal replication initiator protein
VGLAGGVAQVACPHRYHLDWVRENYEKDLLRVLQGLTGQPLALEYLLDEDRPAPPAAAPTAPATALALPAALPPVPLPTRAAEAPEPSTQGSITVNPAKTFESFVVGNGNQLAFSAALAVAEELGVDTYNPLFIYGATGLGKTHLLHAIANGARQRDPSLRILYVTAEQFTNDFVEATRTKEFNAFRERYRNRPQLLLIDDIQFLSGKDRTQEELFHTFESLRGARSQIAFTADELPSRIKGLEPRLRTRFESGMLADVMPPDHAMIEAMVQQRLGAAQYTIEPAAVDWIAQRIRGSVRELEGALNRLMLARTGGGRLTLDQVRLALSAVLQDTRRAPTIPEIIEATAQVCNVRPAELLGTGKKKHIARARLLAYYLARNLTQHSFPEIGRFFHRDHSTIQSGVEKIRDALDARDADIQTIVETIKRTLPS